MAMALVRVWHGGCNSCPVVVVTSYRCAWLKWAKPAHPTSSSPQLLLLLLLLHAGVKRESGSEAAEELMEGLVLLREQASNSARYWLCAACDRKFHTAADFAAHLEACHEQLVLVKQPAQQQQQQQPGQLQALAPGADAGLVPAASQPQQSPTPQQQQQQQLTGSRSAGGLSYITCSKCQVGDGAP